MVILYVIDTEGGTIKMRFLRYIFIISILACMILESNIGICAENPIHPAISPEKIISMTNYDFSILTAEIVPATESLPEYCDVRGVIPPEIKFAVKLPTSWNDRFQMVGNGGFAGTIGHESMEAGLFERYAVAATDTGHDSSLEPGATFAYNNRQKEIDYAFRAVHLTAVTAKKIVEAYYGTKPSYSYWVGCSTGGRQALMEAQRFPDDFDGIIVGAPVLNFSWTKISFIWEAQALLSGNIEKEKLKVLAEAVYDVCDEKDGLKDGLIEDPLACDFNPEKDLPICSGDTDESDCFTKGQIAALKKIYGGVKDSKGNQLFPGYPVGAEVLAEVPPFFGGSGMMSGWEPWIIGNEVSQLLFPGTTGKPSLGLLMGEAFLRYMAFEKDDPEYNWKTFNFDTDPQKMSYMQSILDATDPDLSDYYANGGKIIHYHGWADSALNPVMSVDYYEKVLGVMGDRTEDFYRLYMVPGMFHCSDGVGCDEVDWLTPLVNWVENGIAPEELTGAHSTDGNIDRTRPICPYPEIAKHKGSGDINDASNFVCVEP
jgi:feruloyl esterase